ISLSIKQHVQIGGEGKDITSAIENVAGISVAHIEPNCVREVLDEELRHETLASIEGSHLRNPSMPNKEEEIRQLEASEFPLIIGWALKEVQKYGKKGCGKHMKKSIVLTLEQCFLAQEMLDFLKLKVEGEIEISDLPKLSTIQGWITQYTAQLCERTYGSLEML
ncbi:11007_t:CDS:2, partial [Entrophospora sp. SA101]